MKRMGNTGLPIVLIHKGSSSYLQYSINQAKVHNPASDIYLIGDADPSLYQAAECFDIGCYRDSYEEFAGVYQHFSTNGLGYERFCFERWFVLLSFLHEQQIQECFYMDSDVMLYSNITEEFSHFRQCDMAFSRPAVPGSPFQPCRIGSSSPHSLFLGNQAALRSFCQLLLSLYTEAHLCEWLRCSFLKMRNEDQPGGVCDMTAFAELSRCGDLRVGNLTEIVEGSTFDNNFNKSSHGACNFEVQHGTKRVQWIKGQPYCRLPSTGQSVRFNSLHCQGGAKNLMPTLYRGQAKEINPTVRRNTIKARVKQHIKRFFPSVV